MKTLTTLVAALAACTLSAQSSASAGERRAQIFGEFSRPKQITIAQYPGDLKDQAEGQTGIGVRLMGEMPGTSNWYFELGGKFETSSHLGFNQTVSGLGINTTKVSVRYSYWEMGGAYLWELGPAATFGLHLDLRSETISAGGPVTVTGGQGSGNLSQRASMVRPWLRLSTDVSFGKGGVTPYLGADVAYTPIQTSQSQVVAPVLMDERTVKAMAPQFGASIYFGLKF